jgi:glyoxylase-like metal-dependent hydrolase (beta-lactamase superfamily II)
MQRIWVALVASVAAIGTAEAQLVQLPDWDTVDITTFDLGNGIYMLEGFGGNIGVSVGEDGVFLIDDQYAPLTPKIIAAIKELSDQPIRFVINTHWHDDHTGGNENLGKLGALIVAHDNTRAVLVLARMDEALQKKVAPPPESLPVISFDNTVTFHLNGETIHVFHIDSAHTDGDAVVHFREADVIHTGDAYFNGFYPFIDVAHGGSIDGMIAFYDQLIALSGPNTRIIPGHGPVAARDDVQRYQTMLKTVRDRVAEAIAQGQSLEELIAAEPLADLDPEWGDNLIKAPLLLTIVHADLSGAQR